ncbi:unnamed protein product, partial [Allacma fusca]
LFDSSLKKASNPSEMDPSENSGEEPMEVEDLPLLTEVSETADTEGTYRVGEFCQPRIPMVKQTVKVEAKAGLESKDDTGQRRGDVIDEVHVGSPEVPTSENLDEHEVAVDPLRGTAQPILDFLVEDETGVNVEVVEVADSEMPDEGDGNPDGGEQDERTLGAAADIEEREIGEESTIGLEDFADENESEPFVEITRRRVSQDGNCYCGKERNLNIAELLCASCNRWYHESCIGYQLGKLVPFMTNYVFICKNCSPTGLESFKRNQAQFSQMCVTALANLTQASVKEGRNRKIFSKDKDIIPFFDMHWEGMTTTTRRVTQSWHATVSKALQKEAGTIFTFEEALNDPDSPHFGLLSADLTQIRPNYDAMIKGGHLKVTELGVHQSKRFEVIIGSSGLIINNSFIAFTISSLPCFLE